MKKIKIGLDVLKVLIIVAGVIAVLLVLGNWDSSMGDQGWLYVLNSVPEVSMPISFGLSLTWFVLVLCLAAAVIFGIVGIARDVKKSSRSLVGIGIIVVLALVCYYGFADATLPAGLPEEVIPTEGVALLVSAMLILTSILAVAAILSMVYLEVRKLFK
jgi:hypothetical protein